MVTTAISTQEAIKRARKHKRFLKILFILSIVSFLALIGKSQSEHIPVYGFIFGFTHLILSYFLAKTCMSFYVFMLIALRLLDVAITLLTTPLTSSELSGLIGAYFITGILLFFAFLSCKRIHQYLSPIPVPPKPPSNS